MPSALLVCRDRTNRKHLEQLLIGLYEVISAKDARTGVRQLARDMPDVVLLVSDQRKTASGFLKHCRDRGFALPVVVIMPRGSRQEQPNLLKLGADAFVELPADRQNLSRAAADAIDRQEELLQPPPPVTEYERRANLSELESELNDAVTCFAGKNKVYIQSQIAGAAGNKPRVCLKCPLRADFGLNQDVYYEFIREICCARPDQCEAVQLFRQYGGAG